MRPILVTGGTGYTGRLLLRRLAAGGTDRVRLLARAGSDLAGLPEGLDIVRGDLAEPATLAPALRGARVVLHLAHVRHTAALADLPEGVEHVVVVSSLRALSRVPSPSVDEVLAGERAAASLCAPWTILRPSMIFGPGDDRNLGRLAAGLRRRPWLPVVGPGCLHQPVYVEDVIDAILACPANPRAAGRTYAIAGAEALPYRDLVARVGAAVGVAPHLIPLPAGPIAGVLCGLEWLGLRPPVASEQVRRMLEDKAYDIEPARRDLGYRPLTVAEALRRIHGAEAGGGR